MKTKQRMRLEIKEISAEGSFEGLLSPYGNVDGGGDIVERGAYTKTLLDQGPTHPMLWQHKSDVPVGELTLEDRTDGLWCKGQLLMALPEAQKAYLLVKAKIVKGLSIGFESIKDAIENGVRHLKEIRLYEGSVVTFPMNEMALITSVKAKVAKGKRETKDDFNEVLNEIVGGDVSHVRIRELLDDGLRGRDDFVFLETRIEQRGERARQCIAHLVDRPDGRVLRRPGDMGQEPPRNQIRPYLPERFVLAEDAVAGIDTRGKVRYI